MTVIKKVKAYGNGAHVVLPIKMLGEEVIIMKRDYVKNYLENELATPEEEKEIEARLKKMGLV